MMFSFAKAGRAQEIMRSMAVTFALLILAGCSIAPLPQDITGVDTVAIAARIRCEARDAIRSYLRGAIRKRAEGRRYDTEILEKLRHSDAAYAKLDRTKLHPETQALFNLYEQTAIAFDFQFNIAEINDLNGGAGLINPLARGPLNVGFKAGLDRTRRNVRVFRIVDLFGALAVGLPDDYCTEVPAGPNYLYPITGQIGLLGQVGDFLNLHRFNNLSAAADKPNGPRSMASTLTFTTKISGSVNPTVKLEPLTDATQLASADLSAEASREDVHQVLIVLALASEGTPLAITTAQLPAARASALRNASEGADRQLILRGNAADVQGSRVLDRFNRCLITNLC